MPLSFSFTLEINTTEGEKGGKINFPESNELGSESGLEWTPFKNGSDITSRVFLHDESV